MSAPSAMVAFCDNCGEVMHRVLKGKMSGRQETIFEGVVKCQRCGRVHTVSIREPKPLRIPLILSWMETSQKKELEIDRLATIAVGDRMEFDGSKIEVTAIESAGRRVPKSEAAEMSTIWAKKIDKVKLKVTITRGNRSRAKDMLVEPEKEFLVGDEIWLDGERNIIEKMKVRQGVVYRGAALAAEIVRIYAWAPGSRRSFRLSPEKIDSRRHAHEGGRKARHRQ